MSQQLLDLRQGCAQLPQLLRQVYRLPAQVCICLLSSAVTVCPSFWKSILFVAVSSLLVGSLLVLHFLPDTSRRHHCRYCRKVFCNACTSKRLAPPHDFANIRLCDKCHRDVRVCVVRVVCFAVVDVCALLCIYYQCTICTCCCDFIFLVMFVEDSVHLNSYDWLTGAAVAAGQQQRHPLAGGGLTGRADSVHQPL